MALTWPFPTVDPFGQGRRVDEGWDLQDKDNNGNNPVLAIAAGTVTHAGPDPGGFGPSYPILNFDQPVNGFPAAYYGHTLVDVPDGTHVNAGQQIGHTTNPSQGNANTIAGGGWLEIGFWSGGPTGPSGSMKAALTGAIQGAGGGPVPGAQPSQGSVTQSFTDPVSFIDGDRGGLSDPPNNRPVLWARDVSPYTAGLLHGSMKTVVTPHFLTYFMFNPASVSLSYNFTEASVPISDLDPSIQNDANMLLNQTIQFTLLFDRVYEVGYFKAGAPPPQLAFSGSDSAMWNNDPSVNSPFTMGTYWDIRSIERLIGIYDNSTPQGKDTSGTPAPGRLVNDQGVPMGNAVDVALGSMYAPIFRGYFIDLQVQHTRFSQKMIPVRSEVTVQLARLYIPDPQDIRVPQDFNPYTSTPTYY